MRTSRLCAFVLAAIFCAPAANSQTPQNPAPKKQLATKSSAAELRTAQALENAKANTGALYSFLRQMPKGGDLHNHITGAVYAESLVRFAIDSGMCIDRTSLAAGPAPCNEKQVPAKELAGDMVLYRNVIDNWSMRGAAQSNRKGHDHFFDTFYKFGAATNGHMGEILAEVVNRAAEGNVQYLELMTTADSAQSIGLGSKIGWDDDFAKMRERMLAGGISDLVAKSRKNLDQWEAEKDQLLRCKDANAGNRAPGCAVTVRHIYPGLRAFSREQVFAQLLLAFELANADQRMVAVNLVQPEDWPVPMNDFRLHLRMIQFLKGLYPKVHITLHAGELAPGMVPTEGLRFHIRESVQTAKAERIGHGVDVMHEDDPQKLLSELAAKKVLVEICLTSNDGILGIRGKDHPLHMYLKAGVPVALATDDEGVSRSEMTREYLKAVVEQDLDYITLKKMARWSIEHAFLNGTSLWSDSRNFVVNAACAKDRPGAAPVSVGCRQLLENSEKAREQWKLEKAFSEFEARQ